MPTSFRALEAAASLPPSKRSFRPVPKILRPGPGRVTTASPRLDRDGEASMTVDWTPRFLSASMRSRRAVGSISSLPIASNTLLVARCSTAPGDGRSAFLMADTPWPPAWMVLATAGPRTAPVAAPVAAPPVRSPSTAEPAPAMAPVVAPAPAARPMLPVMKPGKLWRRRFAACAIRVPPTTAPGAPAPGTMAKPRVGMMPEASSVPRAAKGYRLWNFS